MASASLVLVVVWQRAPVLTAALVGPLLAIALYQRSTYRALRAMRLALTDPLTGLGNHRHFHERLAKELGDADKWRLSLSLCLVDIDGFKGINDRFGHPAGDQVLAQVASRLRSGGEAFRLGGDEFAVLLPGFDERAAMAAARAIVERIGAEELDPAGRVTVSAGVATFPIHGCDRDELIHLADGALYWAKEYGKNQARAYRPEVIELAELKRIARGPDRAARLRAAASLARAVDARDTYTGRHSERVARLAASVATRMGLASEEVELTRLAGSLHDLGKLAIPEEILRKPGPLTDPERMVLERHPQIGFRMLESLGIDPVSAWVLHHHERWDGTGYPDGLPGDAIPLGARIIFVADAFDAMTSERVYRDRLDASEALAELARCAGTQFDPGVVAAFAEELGVGFEAVGDPRPCLVSPGPVRPRVQKLAHNRHTSDDANRRLGGVSSTAREAGVAPPWVGVWRLGRGRLEQDPFRGVQGSERGLMTQEPLNREQRRHPTKTDDPGHEASSREKQNEIVAEDRPQDVSDPRTKSTRHKKVTADHWNQ